MTIRDLFKVYKGRVLVTGLAFSKETGEYYSFRTIGEFKSLAEIPEFFDSKIVSINTTRDYLLMVDIAEYI